MTDQSQFHIRLLGSIEVCHNQHPVHGYESTKALALLCYLAMRDQPVSRQHLIHLFWSSKSETRGRNNLSVVLHNLATLVPGLLTADRHTVGFSPDADCWRDTQAFLALLQRDDAESLAAAAALYRGEFLEGLGPKDCPEFDIWLATEREAWRQQIRQVLHRLVQHAYDQQSYASGQTYAARLLELDPLDEAAHRQMMRLLTALDQRSAALEQYRTCCRLLETELGIQPEAATSDLYEQIRQGNLVPANNAAAVSVSAAHNLPHPTGPLIGREAELAHITTQLHHPDCRLLTITGLGGIGKTRLALQAAHLCLQAYPDGVWFVSLASIDTPEHIAATIAGVLPLQAQGTREVHAQLLSFLSMRRMLLLLDNLEHLLDAVALLADILTTAPGITLLCTSRERLNLPGEWVVNLTGLELPTPAHQTELSAYSAVQLFVQCATRTTHTFALNADNQTAIAQLCQVVEGVPLAIELAATWVNVLSCEAIVHELEQTLEILATRQRTVPERHRSMRAVFDHSWQLLNKVEQDTLLGLAIFRGSFPRAAAEQVAGATLPILAALQDKSLVRYYAEEQYSLHELLRQYLNELLARRPELLAEYQRRHSDYWLHFLEQRRDFLYGPREQTAINDVAANIENIRVAWSYAIAHNHFVALDGAMLVLAYFYYVRGWLAEGDQVYAGLIALLQQALADEPAAEAQLPVWCGKALTYRGILLMGMGRYSAARACFQPALELLHATPHIWERGLALFERGLASVFLGEYLQAHTCAQEALELVQTTGDVWTHRGALTVLGLVAEARGELPEAARVFAELVAQSQATGNRLLTGINICKLAGVYHAQGQWERAHTMFAQSREIFATIDYPSGTTLVYDHLGRAYYNEGNYAEAVTQFRTCLEISREMGGNWEIARLLASLGHALLATGDRVQAHHSFIEAADMAVRIDSHSELLAALLGIAMLLAHAEHDRLALALAHLVEQHPASHYTTRRQAHAFRAQYPASPPAHWDCPEFAAIDATDLEQVLRLALDRLGATVR